MTVVVDARSVEIVNLVHCTAEQFCAVHRGQWDLGQALLGRQLENGSRFTLEVPLVALGHSRSAALSRVVAGETS